MNTQPRIAVSQGGHSSDAGEPLCAFGTDGRLDVDTVCRIMDAARVIVEGRIYESTAAVGGDRTRPVFLGTALLTVDLADFRGADGPIDADFARRLRDALAGDRRTLRVLHDRAWRETARILGPETPATLEIVSTLRTLGTTLLADMDLEGPVERQAATCA